MYNNFICTSTQNEELGLRGSGMQELMFKLNNCEPIILIACFYICIF